MLLLLYTETRDSLRTRGEPTETLPQPCVTLTYSVGGYLLLVGTNMYLLL